ncbi:biopolymer transporter ExbD [Niabella ginsenosidivorans]|uniref:Biopolymer transporter ExbD n=1 Tax=Niabella ginsenosidivorans TaxID=1176587 RepID=A0A1A9HWE5_9BACT|nr:biopolymer transporter ExbD [Niabella ginsenosidivorans]ANH79707.1 biopolymer transporter ExbD [Niabella ginsenosidivorans]
MNSMETAIQLVSHKRSMRKVFSRSGLRIDMTPMVDLGFLLITFFIYTSAMSDPATMDLFMPKNGPPVNTAVSGAFTILVGNNRAVAYYEGNLAANASNLSHGSLTELRKALIRKKREVMAAYVPDAGCEAKALAEKRSIDDCRQNKLMVLIKPGKNANYKTIVNVLDEMSINRIARYALVAPEKEEQQLIP